MSRTNRANCSSMHPLLTRDGHPLRGEWRRLRLGASRRSSSATVGRSYVTSGGTNRSAQSKGGMDRGAMPMQPFQLTDGYA